MTLHSEATKEIDLEALRAALDAMGAAAKRLRIGVEGPLVADELDKGRAAFVALVAELTARRARDAEVEALVAAMRMAIRQNSHDMLMTGEELRRCTAALLPFQRSDDKGESK